MLPSGYRTSDGVRDAIIFALAIKVWGVPNLSITLPNISIALPELSLTLPELSANALRVLGGFGLGWFAASLYYGADAKVGADVIKYGAYQKAHNELTGVRGKQEFSDTSLSTYINMSWDKEGEIKFYRPTGKPENKLGYDILLLAVNANNTVNPEKTIVRSGEKNVSLSTLEDKKEAIIKAITE